MLAVWIIALVLLSGRDIDIPRSMLVIATIFFVLLIPAMNDLVRSIERYFRKNFAASGGKQDGADR